MNAALEAVELDHRIELAKARTQLALYRRALVDNGILPPDMSGDDLLQIWEDCRNVILAAQTCVANLGTSAELLKRWA